MKKRGLLVFMSVFLLAVILLGCNEGASSDGAEDENDNAVVINTENAEAIQQGTFKFEEPVTISSVKGQSSVTAYRDGESFKDNVHIDWALEELGINLDFFWSAPASEFNTKLRLMLASGEELPDVISVADPALINDLIESGQYRDISEDFETYASPEMQVAYSQEPEQWAEFARGDKKYGIPIFKPAGNDNSLMWIRQDWLDELDLEAPKTLEEFEHLLEEIKTKNPGEVNQLVPLGLSLGSTNPLVNWFGESSPIMGMFGVIPSQWSEENGELQYGSIQPEMKEGLGKIKEWYDKGYIDEESGLHNEDKVVELVGAGSVGVVFAPSWAANWPMPDIQINVGDENAVMKAYPVPENNGKGGGRGSGYYFGGLMVHKDFKDTDALFLYLNRLYKAQDPDPGSEFEHGFHEGYDYVVLEDGTVSYDGADFPEGLEPLEVQQYLLTSNTLPIDPYFEGSLFKKLADGEEPTRPVEKRHAENSIQEYLDAQVILYENIGNYHRDAYLGPPTETQLAKGQVLEKMESETFLNIIYDTMSIDEFDDFVEQWKSAGGKDFIEEINQIYQEMK